MIMKKFQLPDDLKLDLYTNIANMNFVAAGKCVSPRIFSYLNLVFDRPGKKGKFILLKVLSVW